MRVVRIAPPCFMDSQILVILTVMAASGLTWNGSDDKTISSPVNGYSEVWGGELGN